MPKVALYGEVALTFMGFHTSTHHYPFARFPLLATAWKWTKLWKANNMNQAQKTETHTFPIPEAEVCQLNRVEEQLLHQPLHLKAHDYIRANLWQVLAVTCLLGLLVGVYLRHSNGRCSEA